jgi:hypothetical protein
MGKWGISSCILHLGCGWRWPGSRSGRFIFGTHWIGGWVGPRASLDSIEKRYQPLPGIEPKFPGRPVRSLVTILIDSFRWVGHGVNNPPPSSTKVKKARSCTSGHPYVFIAWYLIKQRNKFTVPHHIDWSDKSTLASVNVRFRNSVWGKIFEKTKIC